MSDVMPTRPDFSRNDVNSLSLTSVRSNYNRQITDYILGLSCGCAPGLNTTVARLSVSGFQPRSKSCTRSSLSWPQAISSPTWNVGNLWVGRLKVN